MTTDPDSDATLLSICVGRPKAIDTAGGPVITGIYKTPVQSPVMVRFLNLDGDRQADLTVHGGVDKAVYSYPAEHYPAWERELARPLPYGTFGENLTLTRLLETEIHLDDILAIGDAVLQISQPRLPCYKLGIKMDDPKFLRKFMRSGRSGFYCRVLQEGLIQAGQPIHLLDRDPSQPTIAALFHD